MTKSRRVATRHGEIAVYESEGQGPALLLIHGNSSSAAIFHYQLSGEIGQQYRVIALDLPGHGDSSDAPDPEATYSIEGYADAISDLLAILDIQDAVILGWSLGGHIGLELISRYPSLRGLLITGTPPVAKDELSLGFKSNPDVVLAGKAHLSPHEVRIFARSTSGEPCSEELVRAVARTDGRARRLMFEKFAAGSGANQKEIVARATIPIAVINGRDEPFVNLDFLARVKFNHLWRQQTFTIAGAGHAPFREQPEIFNRYLQEFISEINQK